MKNFLNGIKSLVIVAMLLISGSAARAAIGDVYSDTFQGVTFTFTQTDADTLTFRLQGDPPLGGDWSTAAFFGAFDLKDLGLDFGTQTGTANGPGATNLVGLNAQLSASSVDCLSAGSPPGSICFDVNPDFALTDPFNLLYTIDFSAPLNIATAGPHLQVVFSATQNGPKVGSLYSLNIANDSPGGGAPGGKIPEPSALILLGSGLLAVGGFARKLNKKN